MSGCFAANSSCPLRFRRFRLSSHSFCLLLSSFSGWLLYFSVLPPILPVRLDSVASGIVGFRLSSHSFCLLPSSFSGWLSYFSVSPPNPPCPLRFRRSRYCRFRLSSHPFCLLLSSFSGWLSYFSVSPTILPVRLDSVTSGRLPIPFVCCSLPLAADFLIFLFRPLSIGIVVFCSFSEGNKKTPPSVTP